MWVDHPSRMSVTDAQEFPCVDESDLVKACDALEVGS